MTKIRPNGDCPVWEFIVAAKSDRLIRSTSERSRDAVALMGRRGGPRPSLPCSSSLGFHKRGHLYCGADSSFSNNTSSAQASRDPASDVSTQKNATKTTLIGSLRPQSQGSPGGDGPIHPLLRLFFYKKTKNEILSSCFGQPETGKTRRGLKIVGVKGHLEQSAGSRHATYGPQHGSS